MHNFSQNVMGFLNYHDWCIIFENGHDSYCYLNQKRITIGINYEGDLRQIVLHEIAHIGTAKYCNQKHNPQFWKHLEYLTMRFLKKELDKYQLSHKKWMSNGIYSMCYCHGI